MKQPNASLELSLHSEKDENHLVSLKIKESKHVRGRYDLRLRALFSVHFAAYSMVERVANGSTIFGNNQSIKGGARAAMRSP